MALAILRPPSITVSRGLRPAGTSLRHINLDTVFLELKRVTSMTKTTSSTRLSADYHLPTRTPTSTPPSIRARRFHTLSPPARSLGVTSNTSMAGLLISRRYRRAGPNFRRSILPRRTLSRGCTHTQVVCFLCRLPTTTRRITRAAPTVRRYFFLPSQSTNLSIGDLLGTLLQKGANRLAYILMDASSDMWIHTCNNVIGKDGPTELLMTSVVEEAGFRHMQKSPHLQDETCKYHHSAQSIY